MRLLAEHATVDTGYGGQFVSGIDGLRSTFGSVSSADAADWFYWVDGVMADVGADAWRLRGGETVWWDYHRWAGAMFIPVSLDAFPAPFAGHPLRVASTDPAGLGAPIVAWLQSAGLRTASQQTPDGSSLSASPPRTWAVIAATPDAALRLPWLRTILDYGPSSGVFVKVAGGRILPLAASGAAGTPAAGVAFATANPARPEAKLLVLLVDGPQDLPALLNGLTPESLAHHVAVYLPSGATSLARAPDGGGQVTGFDSAVAAPRVAGPAARPSAQRSARAGRRARPRPRRGLARLHPVAGFAYVAALAAAGLVIGNPLQLAVLFVLELVILVTAGRLRAALPYLMIALTTGLFLAILNPLFSPAGLDVLWQFDLGFWHPTVTIQGIAYGLGTALRLAVVVLAFALYTVVLDTDDQLELLSRLSFRSGLIVSLATRLFPVLSRDGRRIADAQRSRGIELDAGGRRDARRGAPAAARRPLHAEPRARHGRRRVDGGARLRPPRPHLLAPRPATAADRPPHRPARAPARRCALVGGLVGRRCSATATTRCSTTPGRGCSTPSGWSRSPASSFRSSGCRCRRSGIAHGDHRDEGRRAQRVTYTYPGGSARRCATSRSPSSPPRSCCCSAGRAAASRPCCVPWPVSCPHFHGGTFAGRVVVDGHDTRDAQPRDLAGEVGLVFQDPESQAVMTTVEREIAFGLENLGVRAARDHPPGRRGPDLARPLAPAPRRARRPSRAASCRRSRSPPSSRPNRTSCCSTSRRRSSIP